MLHCMKKLDYLCNHKSQIRSVCNPVEGHCPQAIKIVHHHANGRFYLLISETQSVDPSGKYKRFRFVHPWLPT